MTLETPSSTNVNSEFNYQVSIDWIEFKIQTLEPTNFQTIRRLLAASYVQALTKTAGGSSNTFSLRIYDVTSWATLKRQFERLKSTKPIHALSISAIEISFDAYCNGPYNKTQLIKQTADFYFSMSKFSSANRRSASDFKGSADAVFSYTSITRAIENSRTLYIGNNFDPVSQRVYFKITDKNAKLPASKHCARYEITLRDSACPFTNLDEASTFKFTSLAKWFKFRKLKEEISPIQTILSHARGHIGEVNVPRRAGGGLKKYPWTSQANTYLNNIAYEKLRSLTRRLQSTSRKSRLI